MSSNGILSTSKPAKPKFVPLDMARFKAILTPNFPILSLIIPNLPPTAAPHVKCFVLSTRSSNILSTDGSLTISVKFSFPAKVDAEPRANASCAHFETKNQKKNPKEIAKILYQKHLVLFEQQNPLQI